MKSQRFSFVAFIALIFTISAFSISTAANLRSNPPGLFPGNIIDECIGECGNVAAGSATALVSGIHHFSVSGNLCPNKAAYVIVMVNGNTVFDGLAGPGVLQSFFANHNDQIYLLAYLVDGQSSVYCKRLGNLALQVEQP